MIWGSAHGDQGSQEGVPVLAVTGLPNQVWSHKHASFDMANRVMSNPGSDVTISRIAANGRDKNIHPLFMQPRNAKWGMAFAFDSIAWHLENICFVVWIGGDIK